MRSKRCQLETQAGFGCPLAAFVNARKIDIDFHTPFSHAIQTGVPSSPLRCSVFSSSLLSQRPKEQDLYALFPSTNLQP